MLAEGFIRTLPCDSFSPFEPEDGAGNGITAPGMLKMPFDFDIYSERV